MQDAFEKLLRYPDKVLSIILLYYYDLSIEQAAEILNTTQGNIRVRLHRALRQMRLFFDTD